jgi:tRNA modification GTPase
MPSAEAPRDTIAALATPPGRGGIGVVRISGSRAPDIARAVCGPLPEARRATYRFFRDARGEELDRGIVLYFAAPHSYTGEDVIELQGHGGPVILREVLGACLDAGARLAQPGEFTQRAFLEGRLDLAQAEAVADLIDAASREAARSALRSLSGEFSADIGRLMAQLIELRALTEATLDFPEEELEPLHRRGALERLERLCAELDAMLRRSRQGSLLRSGIHVVLAGAPNVGKSSLLNRLAGEERAIVTPVAGTTRDALREPISIEGVPLVVVDTAGLRPAGDELERLGIERARQELQRADVVLAIVDASAPPQPTPEALPGGAARIDVYNKIDLLPGETPGLRNTVPRQVWLSAKSGAGVPELRRALLEAAGWNSSGEPVYLARERHVRALEKARTHLRAALEEHERWELFAEELRLAQAALAEITGEFTADDLLGEIFGRFCIGK